MKVHGNAARIWHGMRSMAPNCERRAGRGGPTTSCNAPGGAACRLLRRALSQAQRTVLAAAPAPRTSDQIRSLPFPPLPFSSRHQPAVLPDHVAAHANAPHLQWRAPHRFFARPQRPTHSLGQSSVPHAVSERPRAIAALQSPTQLAGSSQGLAPQTHPAVSFPTLHPPPPPPIPPAAADLALPEELQAEVGQLAGAPGAPGAVREDASLVPPGDADCSVCLDAFERPVATPCNHWFCREWCAGPGRAPACCAGGASCAVPPLPGSLRASARRCGARAA